MPCLSHDQVATYEDAHQGEQSVTGKHLILTKIFSLDLLNVYIYWLCIYTYSNVLSTYVLMSRWNVSAVYNYVINSLLCWFGRKHDHIQDSCILVSINELLLWAFSSRGGSTCLIKAKHSWTPPNGNCLFNQTLTKDVFTH